MAWLAFVVLAVITIVTVIHFASYCERALPVVLPIMATLSAMGLLFWLLRLRRRPIAYFEIGSVYAIIVALYALYPMIGYICNGLRYTPYNDNRLYVAQPPPQEIGAVGWYYAVHLVFFALAYSTFRGKLPLHQQRFRPPDRSTLLALVALYLCVAGFFALMGRFFDLSASSYSESYLVSSRLPLVLAQISNHLNGIRLTLEIAILVGLFSNYERYKAFIAIWLVASLLLTFIRLGSRTELALLLLSSALAYNHLVRRIPFPLVFSAALTGLILFIALGLLRGGQGFSMVIRHTNPFMYDSEFETIFANAYDLTRLRANGAIGGLPLSLYLADLVALVPQQFVPFPKLSPPVWYAGTFYPVYASTGGGFAFGTISESVLSAVWIDLACRGAALGLIFARVHRYQARCRPTYWGYVFYVWITVLAYQCFRDTTFSLLVSFFYRFLPVLVVASVFTPLVRRLVRSFNAIQVRATSQQRGSMS